MPEPEIIPAEMTQAERYEQLRLQRGREGLAKARAELRAAEERMAARKAEQ
jgi:hypothetical protein